MRRTLPALTVLLLLAAAAMAQKPREAQWKQVDEAVNKGLPKTAIENLAPIIEGAIRDKAYPEAIRAIAKKIALEGEIQGNKPEEKIVRLEAELAKAPKEMVPVMETILAHWYWHYFQNNRWRFMQRTTTGQAPGKDFTTWDLARLFAEIDKHYTAALSHAEELRKIPIAQYDDLLVKGAMPDAYRPTLYDFIAHEALAFYTSGEQAGAKAEDSFELTVDSPIFAPAEEFLKWQPATTDEQSPTLKAVRLYQELLRFHLNDEDKTALLDADLARLAFGNNKAVGEGKAERYKAVLTKFIDRWGDHEVSAVARYQLAVQLQQEGDLPAAHKLAQQGAEAFPNSVGGKMCFNLVQQIEARAANIVTERVWAEPWPTIRVAYRNVDQVHFRLVRDDWTARIRSGRGRAEWLDMNERNALVARKPDLAWSAKLPPTPDYRERAEELPAPKDLKPGFYFLLASHDPTFKTDDNVISVADVWVSNLAMVLRNRYGEGQADGFVLQSGSGEPIEGAQVQAWVRDNQGRYQEGPVQKTDRNGLFSFATANQGITFLASFQGDQLAAANDLYCYANSRRPEPYGRTVFFTDRSLYRPGQTIQYKGIAIRVDQEEDNYQVLPNETLTVIFQDVNGKEIARQQHRTNDYGSFRGSFTAPRDRLMGRMTIRTEGQPQGAASVTVEEYKRPKFQVTLDAPKTEAKLAGPVHLEGKAIAYTGAAVGGAKVRYRVVRQVRYPDWWGWRYWWRSPRTDSQEIAHGTAQTGVDGGFSVDFTARPDLSVAEKDEPTFQFTIYADVTDTTGETRSAQRAVNVGYTAIRASMAADDWQTGEKAVEIAVALQTLDGEPVRGEGVVKVHRLKQPEKVVRPGLQPRYRPFIAAKNRDEEPEPDPANPDSWALGDVAFEQGFNTDAAGKAVLSVKLPPGPYRAVLETQDRFKKKVSARLPIRVLDPQGKTLPVKTPNIVAAPKWTLEPGDDFTALWGTGYEKGRAFIEIEHRRKVIQAFWTEPGATQQSVTQKVTEAMRGGFTLRVTMVRENRGYLTTRQVSVPWTNKNLTLKWERFVSKMEPGQKETWTLIVTGADAKKAVVEMVAALYDQSLDAYLPHHWPASFGVFRGDYANLQTQFENSAKQLQQILGGWQIKNKDYQLTYRTLPAELTANVWFHGYARRGMQLRAAAAPPAPGLAVPSAARGEEQLEKAASNRNGESDRAAFGGRALKQADENAKRKADEATAGEPAAAAPAPGPDLSQVTARKNLNETAFFFPHLVSNAEGEVRLEFTMPEALTQWKFLGFAHDGKLRGGLLTDQAVTAKDLMVQPNPPRFLREGDMLEVTVKVSNQSATRQTGKVRLTLADARTGKSVDAALGNQTLDQAFDIPAKESRSLAWRVTVPDDPGPVTYKAVAATDRLSDGEEGMIPVLSRRILVTESLPLPIRGPATKKFDFARLRQSGQSPTLQTQSLTVQATSNPSWYAVMALPYLMEYPHECSEQVFNRLYANALARHIAASDPRIRAVFDQWKGTPALDSPLEKNQDVKSVLLEETPWVRQAQAESQARRNVGVLFDDNRLNDETARTLRKLAEMQLGDGAWPWFPGGPANDYITLYITTGFGRLRHLGVKIDVAPAIKSLDRLDGWIDRIYRDILQNGKPEENHLSPTIALYLYGRSFFLQDKPIAAGNKEAVDYFLGQARKYWLQLPIRQSQGHLAIALKRFGDPATAQAIMRSIKEHSVASEELGMFWRDTELSWWWYRAPIETQALMIEAFDEVMNDPQAVEECKVWLLKQKQTQDWKTTKATADAVYALLLRGDNLLASTELLQVTLGDTVVKPEKVEAGTGFYEQRFVRGEVRPEMGQITVAKADKGVAWGSVHWQYLEDMSKVTPYEGTPLTLQKALFLRQNTKKGPVLEPVKGPLQPGDELVVRIVLRTDRDMEYVHLKDYRGSGVEPVNVLSQYKYQDGLAYYESTRDTASHFFIDYLPKGTYVFEYAVRVVHQGRYQTGIAAIQCMYAPEFNSHSESLWLEVK